MPIFQFEDATLSAIKKISFADAGIKEREHIQAALVENIEALLDGVYVIADERNLWADVNRRVDILCIDRQANLVVVELKRDDTGSTAELQAIRYTAMLSTMTFFELCEVHALYQQQQGKSLSVEAAENCIREFLGWSPEGEVEGFNNDPKIVLVSGDFSKELTSTVLWLNTRGLDISCIRLAAYKNAEQLLVDIQPVIPVPEVTDYQVKLRRREEEKADARRYKRDYTRYEWNGDVYWKNQLAHAVIYDWVSRNEPCSKDEILAAFPIPNHPYMIETLEHANRMEVRDGRARHYKDPTEVLKTQDGNLYCVNRGWTLRTVTRFIEEAAGQGYEISVAS